MKPDFSGAQTGQPSRLQPALYQDLITPIEVLEIREKVRRFCDTELAPIAWEMGHREESVANFPYELFKKMAQAGLFVFHLVSRWGAMDSTIRPWQQRY